MKRLPVSPKSQKRMEELKPVLPRQSTPSPPNVLPEHIDLEEAAFKKKIEKWRHGK